MATLLDVGALAFFLPVFVFIFLFTILLGLLEKMKPFGDNRALNVAAAFSVASISVFAGKLTSLISNIVPWIVFLFVMLLLVFVIFGFFDMEKQKIWDLFGETSIFIIILIIIIIGITVVFETTLSPYVAGPGGELNPRTETLRTLTHPRLLGALFTLIMASATVTYLTKKVG